MTENQSKYFMTISLNVLNHLGLNLYSNTPAVLAEVIANSWDADATEVDVRLNFETKTISIKDNGCGMDLEDINEKYLHVGYQKRRDLSAPQTDFLTPKFGRRPMGRKGIGKLSLFSIANQVRVYTRIQDGSTEAFLMDANQIKKAIEAEDPSQAKRYVPESIDTDRIPFDGPGTCIKITELKKLRLNWNSVEGLKRRLARRFSIIGENNQFTVRINGHRISLADRDYFHKARFIFQYGQDYASNCTKLETDVNGHAEGAFDRNDELEVKRATSDPVSYQVKGWIAAAWRSNDLDGQSPSDNDNLNKITIVVRGKVAQEDILQEIRLGGMITKYLFGEIEADFLDHDIEPDIATSSRQRISEDDERYQALVEFIRSELNEIWKITNKLKDRCGMRDALSSNPHLKVWYDSLRPSKLQRFADKIFGDIDKAGIDETYRQNAYANGVLMFEYLKLNYSMELIEKIDITKVNEFLNFLKDVDALEAERYRQIIEERLKVIRKLRELLDEDAKERVLQEYIFDHLYLLDPSWERATACERIERRMEQVLATNQKKLRIDIHYIKYRRVAAAHVIIELKRHSVPVTKTGLESQVIQYIKALELELRQHSKNEAALPIEAICIVGSYPDDWNDEMTREKNEQALRMFNIRVITYDELIDNANNVYQEFISASDSQSQLKLLLERIRNHQ